MLFNVLFLLCTLLVEMWNINKNACKKDFYKEVMNTTLLVLTSLPKIKKIYIYNIILGDKKNRSKQKCLTYKCYA